MLLDRVSIKSEAKDIVKNASVSAYLSLCCFWPSRGCSPACLTMSP